MVNNCQFIGRVGDKPETKYTQSRTAVTNFSIACSEKYKDKDGNQQEKTEWINIVAWQRLAEICSEYLDKGSLVYISGKMQTRSWGDDNGNKRYTTEIVVLGITMLGSKNDSGGGQGQQQRPMSGSDVPF